MKKIDKDDNLLALIISIFTLILIIISYIFPSFDNIMLKLASFIIIFLIIILLFIIFYYLFRRIFLKIKLNKVAKEDLITIEKYYKTNKDNHLLSEYDLYFLFDDIDYICSSFYEMKKNIPGLKNICSEEELNVINNSNNKEIIELYNKSKAAINSIYKYYDETGKRKI